MLLCTDMDALRVKEDTGLPVASAVTAKNASGETVPGGWRVNVGTDALLPRRSVAVCGIPAG